MKGLVFCLFLSDAYLNPSALVFRFAFHLVEHGDNRENQGFSLPPTPTPVYHRLPAFVRDTPQNHCKPPNLKILQSFLSKSVFLLKDD